jgi:predicted dinucleotide-binding enzyme
MKIAIIGKGHIGTALGTGLKRAGHEVKFGHRDPKEPVREAADWGEVIILAVPFSEARDVAEEIGTLANGKPVVDVTNVVGPNGEWAIGFTTSGAEQLQNVLPHGRVVKAFNTVFAQNQSTGKVGQERLSAFIASDDSKAKEIVMDLASDIGFDSVDAGPLKNARYLEAMGMLMISLGYDLNMGSRIGYKLVKG